MLLSERQSLTDLRVICTIAGELGLLTYQLCGLTLIHWDWLQEVGMVRILKIKTFCVCWSDIGKI